MRRLWIIAAIAAGCLAQNSPTFEVASIRRGDIAPGEMWFKGGPGTSDPTRIDYHNVSLNHLICKAYGVEHYQIVAPDWLQMERYEIAAIVAAGTTRDQFSLMIRNLLIDRFKLQVHHDQKEMMGYSLTVAKGGPKLKPHVDTPPPADDAPQSFGSKTDEDGYPMVPVHGEASMPAGASA